MHDTAAHKSELCEIKRKFFLKFFELEESRSPANHDLPRITSSRRENFGMISANLQQHFQLALSPKILKFIKIGQRP